MTYTVTVSEPNGASNTYALDHAMAPGDWTDRELVQAMNFILVKVLGVPSLEAMAVEHIDCTITKVPEGVAFALRARGRTATFTLDVSKAALVGMAARAETQAWFTGGPAVH